MKCIQGRIRKSIERLSLVVQIATLLSLTISAHADDSDYVFTTNDNGSITITGYNGPGGSIGIPNSLSGRIVTAIGTNAFQYRALTGVTIPDTVESIGAAAFFGCPNLAIITIPGSVKYIADRAFFSCICLTNVTIPGSVTDIGSWAFGSCDSLTTVTIGRGVTYIGDFAFASCDSITGIYFSGEAPSYADISDFHSDYLLTVYRLPNAAGWPEVPNLWAGCPTALWLPEVMNDGSMGIQAGKFGFNISWASGMVAVVEANTDLTTTNWIPVATNTLNGRASYFSDQDWDNQENQFYRVVPAP